MSTPADQLKRTLYQLEMGSSSDPSGGHHEASSRLDMLTDVMRGFEQGEHDIRKVRSIFSQHAPSGFDVDLFIADQIKAGRYSDDSFESWPDEEPEDLGPNVVPLR